METTIKLSNGRVFNLEKDDLTTEDYKCLSGVEVRHIRDLQEQISIEKGMEYSEKLYTETGIILSFY